MQKYDTILEEAFKRAKSHEYGKQKYWLDSPWKSKFYFISILKTILRVNKKKKKKNEKKKSPMEI
jgi:hypothetical protein